MWKFIVVQCGAPQQFPCQRFRTPSLRLWMNMGRKCHPSRQQSAPRGDLTSDSPPLSMFCWAATPPSMGKIPTQLYKPKPGIACKDQNPRPIQQIKYCSSGFGKLLGQSRPDNGSTDRTKPSWKKLGPNSHPTFLTFHTDSKPGWR